MSGGIAYVLDEDGSFAKRCNLSMVDLEPVTEEDELMERLHHHGGDLEFKGRIDVLADMSGHDAERLHQLISNHRLYTGSSRAKEILDNWAEYRHRLRQGHAGRVPAALREIEESQRIASVAAE
jgi:glutamate synthase (NADPH/NADH) large chain